MGNIQQSGCNLRALYNLCIIYIYNQVSIFFIKSQDFSKESCYMMWDGIEFDVTAPRYFAEPLPLVTVFQRAQAGHSAVDLASILKWTLNQRNYRERVYLGTYIPQA